jgi:hypothetical protein
MIESALLGAPYRAQKIKPVELWQRTDVRLNHFTKLAKQCFHFQSAIYSTLCPQPKLWLLCTFSVCFR